MSTQDDDRQDLTDDRQGAAWPVLLGALLLAVALAGGVAIGNGGNGSNGAAAPPAPPTAAMPVKTGAAAGAADAASVKEADGVVSFYFASASAELAPDAKEALGNVVKGVATGKTAIISGFGGDAASSGDDLTGLTEQRVQAVRAALAELGIGDDKMELGKPEDAASAAGAQRVEVRLE